jgi:hypothetical protein
MYEEIGLRDGCTDIVVISQEDAEGKSSSIAATAEGEGEAGRERFTPLLDGKDGKQNATV